MTRGGRYSRFGQCSSVKEILRVTDEELGLRILFPQSHPNASETEGDTT